MPPKGDSKKGKAGKSNNKNKKPAAIKGSGDNAAGGGNNRAKSANEEKIKREKTTVSVKPVKTETVENDKGSDEKEETKQEDGAEDMTKATADNQSPFKDAEFQTKQADEKRLREQKIKNDAEQARAEKARLDKERIEAGKRKEKEAEEKPKLEPKKEKEKSKPVKAKGDGKDKGNNQTIRKMTDKEVTKLKQLASLFNEVKAMAEKHGHTIQEHEGMIKLAETQVSALQPMVGTRQMMWKIPAFREKYKEARQGIEGKTVLYSPEFETHRYGYKVALSLCPNGDGSGKNQYMSIFFTILRGEYDSLQVWPFHHKLSFTLIDQAENGEKSHITSSFQPNPIKDNIPFLGRPKTMRNPSLGIPRFAPLVDMWQGTYVVDGAIFIKVEVETNEIVSL